MTLFQMSSQDEEDEDMGDTKMETFNAPNDNDFPTPTQQAVSKRKRAFSAKSLESEDERNGNNDEGLYDIIKVNTKISPINGQRVVHEDGLAQPSNACKRRKRECSCGCRQRVGGLRRWIRTSYRH